jgi:ribose/xylose/arabinose/galactoside ABC-type transport system permease subunit
MLRRRGSLALPVFLSLTFAFFCAVAPRFATASNFEALMAGYAFIAIVAMGESFSILLRGIDLSVGAVMALAGMVTFDASLMLHLPGCLTLALALAAATLAGALNGALIVVLRLPPFIATLATLAAYRGLVFAISGRQLVPELSTTPLADPWIAGLDAYYDVGAALGLEGISLPAIPLSFVLMLLLLVLFELLLRWSRFGRDLYAIGGNPEAARLAGINVRRTIVIGYAMSGFCAGVAALLLVARLTTSTEALGNGMELSAIAAAVIGGVRLNGGVGSMWGPVVGTFLLGVVLMGLTLFGIAQFVQQILTGAIMLAAIAHGRWLQARHELRGATTEAA